MPTQIISSNLDTAKNSTIEELTNIVDAQYENDPNATSCNALYFQTNVANYIKDLAKVALPSATVFVNPDYAGVGSNYFITIAAAHAAIRSIVGLSGNQRAINIRTHQLSYQENLTLDTTGKIVIRGDNQFGVVIAGSVIITAGSYIFENVSFDGNITISNANVIFRNCRQISGTTTILDGGNIEISYAMQWRTIYLEGNNSKAYFFNIENIASDNDGNSIYALENLEHTTFIAKYIECQGAIKDNTLFRIKLNCTETTEQIIII